MSIEPQLADRFDQERCTLDPEPDGRAWAVLHTPRYPSVRDAGVVTHRWRDLRIDPALGGPVPPRAGPTAVQLGRPGAADAWRLPVSGVLGARLAWHPQRPLVAGLARSGARVVVWVADYLARTVRVLEQHRFVTSFTAEEPDGAPPLAWGSGSRLVTLIAVSSPTSSHIPCDTDDFGPIVYEAKGPGRIDFLPGPEELAALAGGQPVLLDLDSDRSVAVGAAGLVRRLSVSFGGGHLLIEYAGDDPAVVDRPGRIVQVDLGAPQTARERVVPPGSRWALDADVLVSPEPVGDGNRLHWTPMDAARVSFPVGPAVSADRWWPLWRDGDPIAAVPDSSGLHLLGPDRTQFVPLPTLRLGRPGSRTRLLFTATHRGDPVDGAGRADGAEPADRVGLVLIDPEDRPDRTRPEVTSFWSPDAGSVRESWGIDRPGAPELLTASTDGVRRYRLTGTHLRECPDPAPQWSTLDSTEVAPQIQLRSVPTCASPATLRLLSNRASSAARLLWLRVPPVQSDRTSARVSERASETRAGSVPILAAEAAGVLELSLDWPAEAGPEYLHTQIVAAVQGAMAELGPGPVVVAGHSFAATLALYVTAHLPEVAGAIVHSGCYNRTSTPHGFQFESRTYWQAPDIYQAFSAFHFADRLTRPVLIVHGVDDDNPSTPADQAIELYRGIIAAGGHARLVLIPGEGHNLRLAESLRTVVAEQRQWLERLSGPVAGGGRD